MPVPTWEGYTVSWVMKTHLSQGFFKFLRPEEFPCSLYPMELCYTTAGAIQGKEQAQGPAPATLQLRFNSSCLSKRSKEKEKCCDHPHFHTAYFCSPSNPAHTELSCLVATHPPMLYSELFQPKSLKRNGESLKNTHMEKSSEKNA